MSTREQAIVEHSAILVRAWCELSEFYAAAGGGMAGAMAATRESYEPGGPDPEAIAALNESLVQ